MSGSNILNKKVLDLRVISLREAGAQVPHGDTRSIIACRVHLSLQDRTCYLRADNLSWHTDPAKATVYDTPEQAEAVLVAEILSA